MHDGIHLSSFGSTIDPTNSDRLQEAVCEKLLKDTEGIVGATAKRLANAGGDLPSRAFDPLAGVLALRELPIESSMKIMLHPTFRFWLQAMHRTQGDDQSVRRYEFFCKLPEFIWAEQAVGRTLDRSWQIGSDKQGGLRCASLGRFIELGPAYANQLVTVSPEDGRVILRCPDGLIVQIPLEDLEGPPVQPAASIEEHGYCMIIYPRIADGRIEVSSRDPFLRVKLTGTNQRTDGTDFFAVDDQLYPVDVRLENIEAALETIRTYWPEAFEDLTRFTNVIVPILPAANILRPWGQKNGEVVTAEHVHLAFTVSSRQGAIYIGEAPHDSTIEMLLHENAHVKLRQIQAIDTLLSDPLDDSVRIPVPWRPDPRPIPGVFEGLFVFSHVAEFGWRRFQGGDSRPGRDRLTSLIRDLQYAEKALGQKAQFTETGRDFFEAMRQWVHDLSDRTGVGVATGL